MFKRLISLCALLTVSIVPSCAETPIVEVIDSTSKPFNRDRIESTFVHIPATVTVRPGTVHKRVIDWTPWHMRLGTELQQSFDWTYQSMNCFSVPNRLFSGEVEIHSRRDNDVLVAFVVKSSGNKQVDAFIHQWYGSVNGNRNLFYMPGSQRDEFVYTVPFVVSGSGGHLSIVKTIPKCDDFEEIYY